MGIEKLTTKLFDTVSRATWAYEPKPETMKRNRKLATLGLAIYGSTYIIPGDNELMIYGSLAYTAVKAYQTLRDWVES